MQGLPFVHAKKSCPMSFLADGMSEDTRLRYQTASETGGLHSVAFRMSVECCSQVDANGEQKPDTAADPL